MNNIYLVQVSDAYGPNKFLPLAVGYLWCYGKNDQWLLKDTLIEKIPPKDYVKTMSNPTMVIMSSYIWNWEYNKTLAIEIKKHWPDCIIVTGGPQVDKNDPNFFDKNTMFDVAVLGEGEDAIKEILARPLGDYDNISHVQTRTHIPDPATRRKSLKDIPSPILEGFYEPIMKKYPKDTLWQVTWESLRGCPYHCTFCDIGDSYWNKLTLFDIDRCKKEIEWMGQNCIEYVSVCDSNWGLLDRDIELTQHVLETKEKYGYPKWWDATWAKNNVDRNFKIALMNKKSSVNIFKGVTMAMQSFNNPTLIASERFNIEEDNLFKYLKKYKEEGIPTYSELIWPMPEETYTSLKNNIQKLIDLGQESYLMIHPLVITYNATMGSKNYQELYGMKLKTVPLDTYYLSTKDLKDYIVEYTDAVYSTKTASWEDVLRGHMFSWISILMYYHGWGHYLTKYMKIEGTKEIDFFESLLQWIENNPDTLLYSEYFKTKQHIYNTFHCKEFWGRKVLGDDDIYWEYKGASSIILHNNIERLRAELCKFLKDTTKIPNKNIIDIINLNLHMCRLKDKEYPYKITAPKTIVKKMLDIDGEELIIDHYDKEAPHPRLWFNKAYHWDRKSGYWRCNASKANI